MSRKVKTIENIKQVGRGIKKHTFRHLKDNKGITDDCSNTSIGCSIFMLVLVGRQFVTSEIAKQYCK